MSYYYGTSHSVCCTRPQVSPGQEFGSLNDTISTAEVTHQQIRYEEYHEW